MRFPVTAALLGCALAAAGCGGGGSGDPLPGSGGKTAGRSAPHPGDPPAAQVIRAWSESLRGGDVSGATALFALPSTVENGTPPLELRTSSQVRAFNLALPCGAQLVRTQSYRGFTLAEFVLTERKGPGGGMCGGVGGRAATAFRIEGGKIREWRRIAGLPRQGKPLPPPTLPRPDSPQV